MDERVIYSVFKNGSDAVALGGLIEVLLLGGFFIFLILRLRNAKKNGRPLVSRSAQTTRLCNFLADHATSVIAAICCIAIALTFHLWNRYRADRDAVASGNYQTLVGTLDGYRIATVTSYHHKNRVLDGVAGLNSTLREQDAIIVNHRTFYVACNKPLDMPLPTIGDEGRCFALRTGQKVRIDFIGTSDGEYRTEPLRISVIDR
jgi:hypothetical protein